MSWIVTTGEDELNWKTNVAKLTYKQHFVVSSSVIQRIKVINNFTKLSWSLYHTLLHQWFTHKQKHNGESYVFIGLQIHKCYGSSQVCKSFVSYLWLEIIDLNFGITPCENLIQSVIHHWWDRNSLLCLNLNILLQTFENTQTNKNHTMFSKQPRN